MPFEHVVFTEGHGARREVDPYGSDAYARTHNHVGDDGGMCQADVIVCEWAQWQVMPESLDPAWCAGHWSSRGLVVATKIGVNQGEG